MSETESTPRPAAEPRPEGITATEAAALMGGVSPVTARENLRRWGVRPIAVAKVTRGWENLFDLEAVKWAVANRPGRGRWRARKTATNSPSE